MGIFTNKERQSNVPPLALDDEPSDDPVNYNNVLDYLVGLSDDEFEKIKKVASIYRKANKDASEALGVENEPSAFISNPADELQTIPPRPINEAGATILDDDEDLASFLDDEPEFIEQSPKTKKSTKVEK